MNFKISNIITLNFIFLLNLTGCNNVEENNETDNQPIACLHNYVSSIIEPSCTSQGYTLHTCSKCRDNYINNYTDPTGHNYIEGERDYSCSKCGKSECDGFTFKTATFNDEPCYVITNAEIDVLQKGVLEVPRKYESLPVRGIMNWAFSKTTKQVKQIIIHDNIKNINNNIWHGTSIWTPDWGTMSTLEEIIFDSTCHDMRIEAGAFNNCPKLSKANIIKGMIKYAPAEAVMSKDGGNAEWIFKNTPFYENNATVKNGLCYIADLLVHVDPNEITNSITIDDGTIMLNTGLFANITFIKNVTIPNTVASIGNKAFYNCKSLETITFNGTMSEFQAIEIGINAFSGTKTEKIICLDGEITNYSYNGYTYYIGR